MRKLNLILLILLSIFLFACPKSDPSPNDGERGSFRGANINFSREYSSDKEILNSIECGKAFEIQGIPFLLERKSRNNERCYDTALKSLLRIYYESELTIDLSKYKDIKAINLGATHTNPYDLTGKNEGSMAILYDFNDKIIAQKLIGRITGGNYNPPPTEFKENLSNVKKIVIQGWAEVTDIHSLIIY